MMPRTDTPSRVVDALVDRVFAALVDGDELLQWLPPTVYQHIIPGMQANAATVFSNLVAGVIPPTVPASEVDDDDDEDLYGGGPT